MAIALLAPIGSSQSSTINHNDILILKAYADAFNQSRNYQTPYGPAEDYCMSTGTFLAYQPCYDLQTCMATANLLCTVSGQQGCMLDVLAAGILDYKTGVDNLDSAYSSFMSGYNAFSPNNAAASLKQMDAAYDDMKSAADQVSQNKMRLPDQIPCPCTSGADCCIGRCPEAKFNYTALALGKGQIINISQKPCSDGTAGGQCSAQKPSECVLGVLVGNPSKCGCPTGMRAASDGITCEFIPCIDNGVSVPQGACSSKTIGKKCVNGMLIDKSSECGCPPGMRAAQDGNACEFNPCMDGNVSVPGGACSTMTIGKKCSNGTLVDMPSECGCPAGLVLSGNSCLCPVVSSIACNTTNVTKFHGVTYLFDRGINKTVNESYTFEKTTCHSVLNTYTGDNCTQLANSSVNSTPTYESPAPYIAGIVQVSCGRCPAICGRGMPIGLKCGDCTCPANLGFCDIAGARVNATGIPAYCADELLRPQKNDSAACTSGFECLAGECRDLKCYNRQHDPLQLFIDWMQGLFGFGK
ncbi:MAG: hypothetical protein WC506_05615 [Candidatus Micrarchaeia archaeon]